MINFPKFKIRCSQIGKIMGGSIGLSESQEREKERFRDKIKEGKNLTALQGKKYGTLLDIQSNPKPTAGMKSYCKKWSSEQVFSRRKEINSKYLDKGNFCEEWSIDFINSQLLESNAKNEEYKEGGYTCGTADIVNNGIDDVKNSYDFDTFPIFEIEIPNKDYEYQLNGYMDLWGKETARLIYTLNDLPDHLIEREARTLAYRNGGQWEDYYDSCRAHFTYGDVDPKYKIKIFHLEYNKEMAAEVKERVEMCRKYIEKLKENLA